MRLALKLHYPKKNNIKGGMCMKKNMLAALKWIGSVSLIFAGVIATPACFLFASQPKCPKSLQK